MSVSMRMSMRRAEQSRAEQNRVEQSRVWSKTQNHSAVVDPPMRAFAQAVCVGEEQSRVEYEYERVQSQFMQMQSRV